MKPDPAIYALATARFGIDPAGALFIDDNPANVAGAEAAGIAAHRFVDAAGLETELVTRGYLAGSARRAASVRDSSEAAHARRGRCCPHRKRRGWGESG